MIVTAKYMFVALAALAAVSAGCGEFTRQGTAPVVVVVDSLSVEDDQGTLQSDVLTKGSIVNDMAEVSLHLILKDPGDGGVSASPTPLNSVTITRYRVEYRRTDGRNVPGTDVPFAFDSGLTFTIAGQGGDAVFQIVRNTAKAEAPLKALATNGEIISTIAYVTFYGHDQAGNDVSANASMGIDFANFADDEDSK
jgi:hypothetical protein